MQILLTMTWLLADGEDANPSPFPLWLPMAIMLAFYFIVMRPAREEKQRRSKLDGLKKNDRIVTSAGIKGTVYSVNREKNEAVVTIDKATKTQMTVTLDSIGHLDVDENKKTDSDKKTETDKE
jgi:preprotein translocase subunit YajC